MKRGVLFLIIAALSAAVPGRADAATTIQPGDYMETAAGACTLGFVAQDDAEVYFMTAAHCVGKVGQDVKLLDGSVFGDVAVKGNPDAASQDWALIAVRDAHRSRVRAAVRGHSGFPSGVATPSETSALDLIQHSGHGIPWFVAAPTREERVGVLAYQDASIWESNGPDTWGDSGGPVVHRDSGQALGLVSRLCIGACTSVGPTVQGILAKAAAKGFAISLRTV